MLAPAITFVIPARNSAKTIGRTFASLQSQDRKDWQAIVVDNGSTDGTLDFVSTWAKADSRIVASSIDKQDVSSARNAGTALAEAHWLCFIDPDDWLSSAFCRTMLSIVAPDIDLVYCGHRRELPDGTSLAEYYEPRVAERGLELLARYNPFAVHAVIVRKTVVDRLGGFDPAMDLCEDWDLWQRAVRSGVRIASTSEILAHYVTENDSRSRRHEQVLRKAMAVQRRGRSADARVLEPAPQWAEGLQGPDNNSTAFMAAWYAAAELGAKGDGSPLLKGLSLQLDLGQDPTPLVGVLIDGLIIGSCLPPSQLAAEYQTFSDGLQAILGALEKHSSTRGLVIGATYLLERKLLASLPMGSSVSLSRVARHAVKLEAIEPIECADGIDVAILDFIGATETASIETAIVGPLTRRDVAELAEQQFRCTQFVLQARIGAWPTFWAPTLLHSLAVLGRWTSALIGLRRNYTGSLRSDLRQAVVKAAMQAVGRGSTASHAARIRQMLGGDQTPKSERARDSNIWDRAMGKDGADKWDAIFAEPDPWGYGSEYEQEKYAYTLELIPDDVSNALELGCAEGVFTEQLAPHVGTLISADISGVALDRAKARAGCHPNVSFRQLDVSSDELPGEQDLILCSEMLYFLHKTDDLPGIAAKLRDALKNNGRIVMANYFLLKDDMSRTGFDWDQNYGGKQIHAAFRQTPGLVLERSIETELYRVDCFRKCQVEEASPPIVEHRPMQFRLDADLARHVVWGGAVMRRTDAKRLEFTHRIPVLSYHRISEDGPEYLREWRVSPNSFREQLQLLRAYGFYSVTLDQVRDCRREGRLLEGRPVLITFDDAYRDFADVAWPLLRAHDFGATVFTPTDWIGDKARWDVRDGQSADLMSWDTISSLSRQGVDFGSHLASHTAATHLSSRDLIEEFARSRERIETATGLPVTTIAAPFGIIDERFQRLVPQAGLEFGFTAAKGVADIWWDAFSLPRITVLGTTTLDVFAHQLGIELTADKPTQHERESLVSVIIPAYNAANTLHETLQSVRSQTHQNLEILVVDDGSTDETPVIVARHAEEDARVRLIRQANAGVAAARNRGIKEASGELIAPIDADDLWAPGKIKRQVRAIETGGSRIGLVYTWHAVIDEASAVTFWRNRPEHAGKVVRQMCIGNFVGNGSSALMRKSAIVEAGGYDPSLHAMGMQGCEDTLLYFRISEDYDFEVVPDYLTGYRDITGSMSKHAFRMIGSFKRVAAEMRSKYPEFSNETRYGELLLANWLLSRAAASSRPAQSIALLLHMAKLDLRFTLLTAVPFCMSRLLGRPPHRPEPAAKFPIGFILAKQPSAS